MLHIFFKNANDMRKQLKWGKQLIHPFKTLSQDEQVHDIKERSSGFYFYVKVDKKRESEAMNDIGYHSLLQTTKLLQC